MQRARVHICGVFCGSAEPCRPWVLHGLGEPGNDISICSLNMKNYSREADLAKKLRSLGPNSRIHFTRLLTAAGTVYDHDIWLFALSLPLPLSSKWCGDQISKCCRTENTQSSVFTGTGLKDAYVMKSKPWYRLETSISIGNPSSSIAYLPLLIMVRGYELTQD